MKRIALFIVMAVAVVTCLSSCQQKEKYDTFVEWGFAKDANSEIFDGYETWGAAAQVIYMAFDHAFLSRYEDIAMEHKCIMKLQAGKQEAIKNAKATADQAHASIEEGHVCAVDGFFVVRIKYNSDKYETVWSHDYRP